MYIGSSDYNKKLWEYFVAEGPNPGNNMASSWVWYLKKEREFCEKNDLIDEKFPPHSKST